MLLSELWSGDVKTKKHPPEELFSKGSASEIIDWLVKEHDGLKGAMSALNFYINRAGKNLNDKQKAKLEHAKALLHHKKEVKEDVQLDEAVGGVKVFKTKKEGFDDADEFCDELAQTIGSACEMWMKKAQKDKLFKAYKTGKSIAGKSINVSKNNEDKAIEDRAKLIVKLKNDGYALFASEMNGGAIDMVFVSEK